MNKLIMTSALTTVMLSGAAFAQIDAQWSGNYNFGYSIVDSDTNPNAMSVQHSADWELDFKGSFEMDNGITAFVDFEVDAQGDQTVATDDIELGLRGSFGTFGFGKIDYTDTGASYVPLPYVNALDTKIGEDGADFTKLPNDGDVDGSYYMTPSIMGLGAVVGYHAGLDGNSLGNYDNDEAEILSTGINYSGDFGDASVEVGAAYTIRLDDDEINETTVGASVGFGEFGITAAYEQSNTSSTTEEKTFGLSGDFATGPWSFTAGYSVTDEESTTADTIERSTFAGNVSYAFGPGVALGLYGIATEDDNNEGSELRLYTSINF